MFETTKILKMILLISVKMVVIKSGGELVAVWVTGSFTYNGGGSLFK